VLVLRACSCAFVHWLCVGRERLLGRGRMCFARIPSRGVTDLLLALVLALVLATQ